MANSLDRDLRELRIAITKIAITKMAIIIEYRHSRRYVLSDR